MQKFRILEAPKSRPTRAKKCSAPAGKFGLLSLRQDSEHEQRVQYNVEYAAYAQAETGLAGVAHTAEIEIPGR